MVDATRTTSLLYDAANRLVSKTAPQGTLTYTYDGYQTRTVKSSNAGWLDVQYGHDARGRLTQVTDNASVGSTQYQYSTGDQLTQAILPNGVTESYTYDQAGRIASLALARSGSTLAQYNYVRDVTGMIQQIVEGGGRTSSYSYDSLRRLAQETVLGTPNGGSVAYALDAVGNRLSQTSSLPGIASSTATYDRNDQTTGAAFDANGNLQSLGGLNLQYDAFDRLVSFLGPRPPATSSTTESGRRWGKARLLTCWTSRIRAACRR